MFSQIRPKELLRSNWNKGTKEQRQQNSPHVLGMIDISNAVWRVSSSSEIFIFFFFFRSVSGWLRILSLPQILMREYPT